MDDNNIKIGKHIIIKEYNYITILDELKDYQHSYDDDGNILVSKKVFNMIEEVVLSNKTENEDSVIEIMILSQKKFIGKIIKAKNYVGTIVFEDGYTIEILPKIYGSEDEKIVNDDTLVKKLFIKMLKSLKGMPFKQFKMANLKTDKLPLFEIFINMFLNELEILFKRGVKPDYITLEGNRHSLKGKLKIQQHIYKNIIHKERFYIEYDEYLRDRPENRLIKATLLKLSKIPKAAFTQRKIYRYLEMLDDINTSSNYEVDFINCKIDRTMTHYKLIMKWCRLFLKNEGFTNFRGEGNAIAILFPMEKIFESYVAYRIKGSNQFGDYLIKTQDKEHHLIEKPNECFSLKPDIVLQNGETKVIIDTKWKLLINNKKKNYGISQSDIYQMYAYGRKYNAKKVVLLYPMVEKINREEPIIYQYYKEEGKLELIIAFIDLLNCTGLSQDTSKETNYEMDRLKELIENSKKNNMMV